MGGMLQWAAIVIEFVGLTLIAVELYFPGASERLKQFFERIRPRFFGGSGSGPGKYRVAWWVGSYIAVWVAVVAGLSIWDSSMSVVANLAFTVFTILFFVLIGVARAFVGLGVVLGRGNSVGGVGLVLALIGFSMEISQLLL